MDTQKLHISSPEELHTPVNLVIANILLAPLTSLKPRFHQLIHYEGQLVISGILTEQAPLLIETYEPQFSLIGEENLNGWSLLIFARK